MNTVRKAVIPSPPHAWCNSPLVGQGLLIIETSRSHSVGFLQTSDQPDAETSSWQHTTTAHLLRNKYGSALKFPGENVANMGSFYTQLASILVDSWSDSGWETSLSVFRFSWRGFLGAFAILQKSTISFVMYVRMTVCPSARNNSPDFHEIYYLRVF